MFQTFKARRRAQEATAAEKKMKSGASGPSVQELAAGAAPTTEQMGSRVDLPGEIREKMESSFGADFSNVKLFESQTVADAGAQAVTQGNNIAFAPGQLDLTSTAGQALLGHELSHVVSQSRGESAGRGFLNDSGLEAQADRQGMLAARGQSAYSGPVSPVGASSTASAAGPMQAKKPPRTKDGTDVSEFAGEGALQISEPELDKAKTDKLNSETEKIRSGYTEGMTDVYYPVRQEVQKDYSRIYGSDLYRETAPSEDEIENLWLLMYSQGYSDKSFNERSRTRGENGMTYDNFKSGIANARKRRGLSN